MARAAKQDSNSEIINGVIYARYSEGPNQTEASIEGQVRECKEYAKRNGIRIINVYSDSKHTGTNDNRAEFQKMLRDSRRGGFSVVVVWKIDRFGRNRAEMAQNKALLKLQGVKVVSAKEYIPDSPEGIILESVLEGMAEYYSANLSQNIKRGMKENALHCKSNGSGKSLGYIVDKDGYFEIEPNEATIVKTIFQKYDEGMKIADIWREIVASGAKTKRGKDFTQYGISRVLSNRAYIGEYRYGDIVTPGGMPRIIDDDLFNRVQERRALSKKEWLETEVTRITRDDILNKETIEFIADRVVEIQRQEQEDKSILRYYEQQLRDTQSAINNIMKAIEAGIITSSTKSRLFELEEQKSIIEGEIEREKIITPVIEKEQVIFSLERFFGGDINNKEYQRNIIDMFVNKVILYDNKIIITYNISSQNEISVDVVEQAAFAALDECSSKLSLAPPAGACPCTQFRFTLCKAVFLLPLINFI